MILGIDASNIRAGGGITHLLNLLQYIKVNDHLITKVVVWSGRNTIKQFKIVSGVSLLHVPLLDHNLVFRMAWQRWILPFEIEKERCDLLFSPGGILPGSLSIPSVVLSQNLLPFENSERQRYPFFSFMRHKLTLIRKLQVHSMQKAEGLIFLSHYAQKVVTPSLSITPKFMTIIPHGVEDRFFKKSRVIESDKGTVFKLLYVSTVDLYKHQWHVAEAVAKLREKGILITVDFVGGFYKPAKERLLRSIRQLDPDNSFLSYKGATPFSELHHIYATADAFVFASSCENLPNILIEAMSSGLPIACSDRGPMPEVLQECGVYFDPENSHDIAEKLLKLIENPKIMKKLSNCAVERSKRYSWEDTAKETFYFIEKVYQESAECCLRIKCY